MLQGVASRTLAGKGELERRGSAGALCEGEVHLARTTERTLGEWVDLRRRRGPWAKGGGSREQELSSRGGRECKCLKHS